MVRVSNPPCKKEKGTSLSQPVLWKQWMPTPSVGLAFCFFTLGEVLIGIASWALWHWRFGDSWMHWAMVVLFVVASHIYLLRLIYQEALLRSPASVRCIEWIWTEPNPVWRVVLRDGHFFSFSAWEPESWLTFGGASLLYPTGIKTTVRAFILRRIKRRLIILPYQVGRVEYRLLCKYILNQPNSVEHSDDEA